MAVRLDGQALSGNEYQVDDESLTIHAPPAAFELEIETRIKPEDNSSLLGLYKSQAMYCTQCEAQGFRKITYYQDRPDVLAKFTTSITADAKRFPVLLSNGNLGGGRSGCGAAHGHLAGSLSQAFLPVRPSGRRLGLHDRSLHHHERAAGGAAHLLGAAQHQPMRVRHGRRAAGHALG